MTRSSWWKLGAAAIVAGLVLSNVAQWRRHAETLAVGDSLRTVAETKDATATYWADLATALRMNLRVVIERHDAIATEAIDSAATLAGSVDSLVDVLAAGVHDTLRPALEALEAAHEAEGEQWARVFRAQDSARAMLELQVRVDSVAIDSLVSSNRFAMDSLSTYWEDRYRDETSWSPLGLFRVPEWVKDVAILVGGFIAGLGISSIG